MTEKENNTLSLILEKVSDISKAINELDGKVDTHAERLIFLEVQQKFIEGTFKQYKEDIFSLFETMKENIRDSFTIVHDKIRSEGELTDEKINNTNE